MSMEKQVMHCNAAGCYVLARSVKTRFLSLCLKSERIVCMHKCLVSESGGEGGCDR